MLIVVIGGAGSGKSRVAESLVERMPAPVIYVATLIPDHGDPDLMARIAKHQGRRPESWQTVDATAALADQLLATSGTVLLDSLGSWLSGYRPTDDAIDELATALRNRSGDAVIVTDEVGMSVHPGSEEGRAFRDALGAANQRLAAVADQTLFVVAGRVLNTAPVDPTTILGGL